MWIEIGEVTGSAGSSDGGQLNGITYDHIIPVEIETPGGVKELKLGYNDAESHFTAAQRFIDDNVLDQGYLRQIADFIAARAGKSNQPTFDMTSSSTQTHHTLATAAPPPRRPNPPTYKTFPSPVYYTFDDVPSLTQLRKLAGKVSEFNEILTESSKLLPSEVDLVNDLVKILGETSYYHSSTVPPQLINVVAKMVQSWDNDKYLFPSYDLFRMICLHPSASTSLVASKHFQIIMKRALNLLVMEASQPDSLGSPQSLLCLRFLTNILKVDRSATHQIFFHDLHWYQLNEFFPIYLICGKKTHRYASLLFLCNLVFSVFNPLLAGNNRPPRPALEILRSLFPHLLQALQYENENLDSIFKGLVTLGTVFLAVQGETEMTLYIRGFHSQLKSLFNSISLQWGSQEKAVGEYLEEVDKALDQLSR